MSRTPLYRPLDWLVVRTPLRPVEDYLGLSKRSGWPVETVPGTLLPADHRVRKAIEVGGGDLARALAHPPSTAKQRERLAGKLSRYLIRMSTRPTPYGLFAGVGLGRWGEHTEIDVDAEPERIRSRPDMGWLLALVADLESRPEVRGHLRWYSNPLVLRHSGRVFLAEQEPNGIEDAPAESVSVRATGPVRAALAACASPIDYPDLVTSLLSIRGATPDKVERALAQLQEHTILITDLRPPVTEPDPARYVAHRLATIPDTKPVADALHELLDAMHDGADYQQLIARAQAIRPSDDNLIQVDSAIHLPHNTINKTVATEAARATELLLCLSPISSVVDGYRHDFRARYGEDCEVPLLELLDPVTGLGPVGPAETEENAERDEALRDLALDAIRTGARRVELDEATLNRLRRCSPAPQTAPASLELSTFVLAESTAALDAGEFQIMVGPNVGGASAGRALGRFADLIGPAATEGLRAAARAESSGSAGAVSAEVVYQARKGRTSNVSIRPLTRDYQVVIGTVPGGDPDRAIPVRELTVGLRDNRFVLRWPARDVQVIPGATHMLNIKHAPPVVRFLELLRRDGRAQFGPFDWGPASGFPFLPRVCAGRAILAPARWRLPAGSDLPEVLARWQVPRYVYLTVSDNRLLLDLDDPAQAEQLRVELAHGKPIVLHEALPGPEHAWLPGADGNYLSELVVPLVLASPARQEPVRASPVRPLADLVGQRLRPPGSDWLYTKLYLPETGADALIAEDIREFAAELRHAGLIDNWFFIRYRDPDPHLRLRLHGTPEILAATLEWANRLVDAGRCQRFCLDTYDQEVERYGGPAGIEVAEQLFGVDSRAVAELLRLDRVLPAFDRQLLVVRTVDELLAATGYTEAERTASYRAGTVDRRDSGATYRARQRELRQVLGDPDWLANASAERAAVLAAARADLAAVGPQLDALAARGELWQSRRGLARSFVHMHCNRLLGIDRARERETIGLLLRTRESLSRAPLNGG